MRVYRSKIEVAQYLHSIFSKLHLMIQDSDGGATGLAVPVPSIK